MVVACPFTTRFATRFWITSTETDISKSSLILKVNVVLIINSLGIGNQNKRSLLFIYEFEIFKHHRRLLIVGWSMNLIRKLAKDGNYKMSLLIALGCFTGLRISDIRVTFFWKKSLLGGNRILSPSFSFYHLIITNCTK